MKVQRLARYGVSNKHMIAETARICLSDRDIVCSVMKVAAAYEDAKMNLRIILNTKDGAILNQHMRFYDKRIGQSVTLGGRQIVRHMSAQINQLTEGTYDYKGLSIIYNDTDSAYFSIWPLIKDQVCAGQVEWNKEAAIKIYDDLAEQTNSSFPEFMEQAFHVPRKNGAIIKAGRELVGDRALFITKKRYAINIYDKEGKRKDVGGKLGQIKAMGLELKRSDTPAFVQDFLFKILENILGGASKENVIEMITCFKLQLKEMKSWTKGSPKSVNNLTMYETKAINAGKKVNTAIFKTVSEGGDTTMPGHVRASLNWNYLRKLNSDNYSQKIVDGMRIVVCKLKNNLLGFTSIAYPVDELRLPEWFITMPFDDAGMERTLVDEKIDNMLGVLGWNLRSSTDIATTANDLFVFG